MNAVQKAKARVSLDTMVNVCNQAQREARMEREAEKEVQRNVIRMELYLAQKAGRPGVWGEYR